MASLTLVTPLNLVVNHSQVSHLQTSPQPKTALQDVTDVIRTATASIVIQASICQKGIVTNNLMDRDQMEHHGFSLFVAYVVAVFVVERFVEGLQLLHF